jgi:hypothetical protein
VCDGVCMNWSVLVLLWVWASVCYVSVPVHAVRRNVTVIGVEYSWNGTGLLPRTWNASAVVDGAVQDVIGECPAGRYCPSGVKRPVVCPAGTYSTAKRLSSPCASKCAKNWYCPDPAQVLPCPNFTTSDRGATSQARCVCLAGYQCTYKKNVNVNIGLNVPYKVWVSTSGAAMRQAVLQAVAESAGVSIGSVRIDKVLPGISRGMNTAGAPSGARRLLDTSESAVLSVSVSGADRMDGLREKLRARREFKRGSINVYWKRIENVNVVKRSA